MLCYRGYDWRLSHKVRNILQSSEQRVYLMVGYSDDFISNFLPSFTLKKFSKID